MGRITRYDVSMNGKIIYSGTDLSCGARRLTPDTEYTFVVTALTNEGKFESKVTKKRTAKDEFDPNRPPLYQPPKKEEDNKSASQKKRKSVGDARSARLNSAKGSHLSCTPERPISASSAHSSHPPGMDTPRVDPKEKEEKSPPASSTQKARTPVKMLDTKKENIRPRTHRESSSTSTRTSPSASGLRDPHHHSNTAKHSTRLDKPSGLSKPAFPVTVSYVSIQGGDDQNLELDAIGPDFPKKTFIRSPTYYDSNMSGLRVERSRTTLSQNKKSRSPSKLKLNKLDSSFVGNGTLEFPRHPSMDFGQSNGVKSPWLPKPTVPSQDYLDGSRGVSATSDVPSVTLSVTRSMPSPRTSMDFAVVPGEDLEALDFPQHQQHRGKWRDEDQSALWLARTRTPVDSYFIEQQQVFIHRAATFTNSHRPGLRKTQQLLTTPVQVLNSASLQLPENKITQQRLQNKFIPMQLRTQPNNLTVSQIQRMNTTLSEPSNRGMTGRRLEALARSQTQVSMKGSNHTLNRSAPHAGSHSVLNTGDLDVLGVGPNGLLNGAAK
ncbi:uncharacterized protein LOC101845718 [Aplysia californica]|uniref:Uncharacterized protein LOC101845718 n=1 Tax=Aplysia californica TaxID=6500 RepID=A0ABM1A8T4_APLCA|nr:uncharacterized protein LOC101845718 [Aplysia californica]